MYLSTGHVCFYAGLGALAVKKLLLPWSNVVKIEKTVTNYDVSSGIKIVARDGDVRHLTQFVARDKVYDMMQKIWLRAARATESTTPPARSEDVVVPAPAAAAAVKEELGDSKPLIFETPAAPVAPLVSEPDMMTGSEDLAPPVTVCEHWIEPGSEAAGTVVLPFSLGEFLRRFIDDDGAFFNAFHAASGLGGPDNCWIKPYYKVDNGCCSSREFNFQQPITTSFPLAPATTRVKQTHRWFFPAKDLLYFGTSSMMPDIPYGSSFSIESKWRVREKDGGVEVSVFVEGNYFKWLFGFRNTVEAMIKKDGNAYVKGLMDAMVKNGQKQQQQQQQQQPVRKDGPPPMVTAAAAAPTSGKLRSSLIKPSAIRETPPRLTPPPKKAERSLVVPSLLVMGCVMLVLLVVCVWYLRSLHAGMSAGRPVSSAIIQNLKAELAALRDKVGSIERLVEQLERFQ